MTTARHRTVRRLLSGLLAFLIGFGPLTPLAMAATTPLADGPINVNIKAHPNIVYTLDDSTSMLLAFLPDYVVVNSLTNAATSYCRGPSNGTPIACGSVGSATIPQYDYATWGESNVGPYPNGYGNSSYGPPIVMTAAFNAMFYNPLVTYTAPLKFDGTSYLDMNETNTSNWKQVPIDPYLFPTKYVNLQTKVNVGVWCNTTYAGTMGALNGLAIGGDYCRINGFAYAAGANGAPKTLGDYSYPFPKVAADSDNSPYFAQTGRYLYCDPTKMNGSTTTGTGEVAPLAPTCDACAASCPAGHTVEDPTSPAGCDVGCTNPAECTKCNTKCDVALVYACTQTCSTAALNCTAVGGGNYAKQTVTCTAGPFQKCTAHNGACATTGAWKLDSAACSTKINGKSQVAWTPSAGTVINTTTYEQDANLNGDVCRRNNFTYPDGTVADGWTYSTSHPVYKQQVGSCGTITATINRHYYKALVQWCDTQLPTGGSNDKWRGYGKGTCQAEKTSVYKWPRFFKAGAYADADFNTTQDNYNDNTAFELVELDYKNKKIIVANGSPQDSITHTLLSGDTISRDASSTTPAASELVNYANWFSYYRSRILAAKTVTSLAFSDLTDKFRVGFHTLSNNPATTFLTLADFTGGSGKQRDLWYQKLTGVSIPMGNDTPLLDAVVRIGEWFKASSGTHPSLSGSTDPINLSCQKNYHIMFTDGYTNQNAKPTVVVGNIDGSKIPAKADDTMPESIIDLVPGTDWPKRLKEGSTAVDDSLSDYSLYYWMKDLRPPTFDAKVADNNVPSTENDPAKWQHLNFAALSLGTEGVLSSLNTTKTEAQIAAGTSTWTTPTPTVFRPGVTGVDDLWHAAVTGRSQFVNARDPQELQTGMASILSEIKNLQAARAGAAFSSVNFAKDNNFIYRVTIEPGWGGTLTKVLVDPKGGGEVSIGTKYHDVLSAQVTPSAGNLTPWYDKRNVITWDPSAKAATAFRLGKMPSSESDTLGKDDTERERIIAYLRGDRSNEGSALKNYRVRSQILGDIVNSSPVIVGPSQGQYSDSTDPGYEDFKKTNETRKKMVYVGSNDGMLHAFDEDTGTEVWSYVPSTVYSSVADTGLAMLAKKEPFFKHQMFVDSTPVAVDVNIGGTWKTLLIGGVGKGGKSYYAIDITDPAAVKTEDDAAAKVLWEFTDSDMGYTFGKPLIGKTYADNTWVAVLPAGYNNNSGKGKLFFVRLSDGKLLRTLETSVGSGSDPSGLSQVSGFVLSFKNQFIEQIYGGDLKGNVWRFDVSNPDASKWSVDQLATLTSTDGTAQSVTTAPQIEVDFANGVDRYVMVGTGRLLHEDDLTTYGDQVQTMYVIRDGTVLKMNTSGLPYNPRTDTDFSTVDATGTTGFSGLSVKGWYMDLPKGERIIAPIAAELNLLGFAGSLPPENECLPGLAANIYVRDFPHGDSQLVDSGGAAMASTYAKEGAVGMEFINIYSDTPNDPTLKLAITLGSDGKTIYIDLKKGSLSGDHRMSWRLMGQ